jgi:hypothetical protein
MGRGTWDVILDNLGPASKKTQPISNSKTKWLKLFNVITTLLLCK